MRYSALLLSAFSAVVAGCTAAPASESAQAEKGDRVTAILNAGVAAELGETKFLFDPLYDNHFGSLAELDDALIDAIINGDAPYDDVDAVFVSHAHGDHFSAAYLNRLMAAQGSVKVVAPAQAAAAMRKSDLWQDSFEDRITTIELRNGEASKRFDISGAAIEAIRTPHSGWPERHGDVHNITFRVSATGTAGKLVRVMHMGDADPAAQHFAMNPQFFSRARTNVAVVPYWFFEAKEPDMLIDRTINASAAVGVHVPVKTPGWLTESQWDYFTAAGQEIEIAAPAQ